MKLSKWNSVNQLHLLIELTTYIKHLIKYLCRTKKLSKSPDGAHY